MSYVITRTYNNGYRCGCCYQSWDRDPIWENDREVALAHVPTTYEGDPDLERIEVRDGSSGEVIAWAQAEWPKGFGKSESYQATHWTGHRPDVGDFEFFQGPPGMTWEQLLADLQEKDRAKRKAEAERKLKEATEELERLGLPE